MTIAEDRRSDLLDALPEPLRGPCRQQLAALPVEPSAVEPKAAGELIRVLAVSPYCGRVIAAERALLDELLGGNALDVRYDYDRYRARLAEELAPAGDDGIEKVKTILRRFRHRHLTRIAWQDINDRLPLESILAQQSQLAAALIDAALEATAQSLVERWGHAVDASGAAQRLTVLGMGKLGGDELNFSSDVDLIFVYDEDGHTSGGRQRLNTQEYFNRLVKQLLNVLGDYSEHGFVHRVDLRLRPFGNSGPLAMSSDAFMAYVETHARHWERYALIKARAIAGDTARGEALLAELHPFVYRRYLDFTALGALREMKQHIVKQVALKDMNDNIKLGAGGIREIEFIGQAFQLIYGGHRAALRDRSIVAVLEALAGEELLPKDTVDSLLAAYAFLRRTENRLQQIDDQQTHALPEDDLDRARVAYGMGYASWADFDSALAEQRSAVAEHFDQLLRPADDESTTAEWHDFSEIWMELGEHDPGERAAAVSALDEHGFPDAESVYQVLDGFRRSAKVRGLSAESRARLDAFMPRLLMELCDQGGDSAALVRLVPLLEILAQRSVYLAMLMEQPKALETLLQLAGSSRYFVGRLTHQPNLLDELLDVRSLYAPPGPKQLAADLQHQLAAVAQDDLEGRMNVLRLFKNAETLKVTAADVIGKLPLAEVSNHLSFIAETMLAAVLEFALDELTRRHGQPRYQSGGERRTAAFAIVAYGKLGGLELGYGSDLDLIFLHDSGDEQACTDGPRSIDNQLFFTRLAQRLIHYLSTQTAAGALYEIDARLRPSGNAGLLVTGLNAFQRYQENEAWTWEHQALIRARAVAGERTLRRRFEKIRRTVLCRPRDAERLRADIVDMRERMRGELDRSSAEAFDLKQGRGGMTDIEFLVQYVTLKWAHRRPALVDVSDNLRLLDALNEFEIIDTESCAVLYNAYFAFRAEAHRAALQDAPALVGKDALLDHRRAVQRQWARLENGEL